MRTLTLGTLIVAGGVLASLPFRRPQPIESLDAFGKGMVESTGLATGPTRSPMSESDFSDRLPVEASASMPPSRAPVDAVGGCGPWAGGGHWADGRWSHAIPSSASPRPRRSVDLPLTFDDLAVPLETPHYRDERFSAVAKASSSPPAKPPIDGLANAMAAMESFSPTVQTGQEAATPPSWNIAAGGQTSVLEPAESAVAGRLAAATSPPERVEAAESARSTSVPADATPPRIRHWIRQPR